MHMYVSSEIIFMPLLHRNFATLSLLMGNSMWAR